MSIFCSCCGEEVTAPKFNNDLPYGYSCYEKLFGKKPTDKRKFVEVKLVGEFPTEINYFPISVEYNGKRYRIQGVIRDTEGKLHSQLAVFGENSIYMVTHDKKGKAIWSSIK